MRLGDLAYPQNVEKQRLFCHETCRFANFHPAQLSTRRSPTEISCYMFEVIGHQHPSACLNLQVENIHDRNNRIIIFHLGWIRILPITFLGKHSWVQHHVSKLTSIIVKLNTTFLRKTTTLESMVEGSSLEITKLFVRYLKWRVHPHLYKLYVYGLCKGSFPPPK